MNKKSRNTKTQRQTYINTKVHKYKTTYLNTQLHKYKVTNTQTTKLHQIHDL